MRYAIKVLARKALRLLARLPLTARPRTVRFKLRAIDRAARYRFPTCDIGPMLAEIGRGHLSGSWVERHSLTDQRS